MRTIRRYGTDALEITTSEGCITFHPSDVTSVAIVDTNVGVRIDGAQTILPHDTNAQARKTYEALQDFIHNRADWIYEFANPTTAEAPVFTGDN